MSLWTDGFHVVGRSFIGTEKEARRQDLLRRRRELERYELESYAALWRKWEPAIRVAEGGPYLTALSLALSALEETG